MSSSKDTLILLYEVEQIDRVLKHLRDTQQALETCRFVAMEYDVDRALEHRGTLHTILTDYVPLGGDIRPLIERGQTLAREFHRLPSMQFFTYRGISIGQALEPMLESYLELLAQYVNQIGRIVGAHPGMQVLIPYSTHVVSDTVAPLVPFEIRAPVDAAFLVGKHLGIAIQTLGVAGDPPTHSRPPFSFSAVLLQSYNLVMSIIAPKRVMKVFASEYWRHISPFIEQMDDVELVLMDRSEIKNIPWRQMWRHRMRFIHPHDTRGSAAWQRIGKSVTDIQRQWPEAKTSVRELFRPHADDVDHWPAVEQALDFLVLVYTERIITTTEGLYRILEQEKPDKILLRASIGGAQHHFFVATQVAHILGIPSIELQHAGAYMDWNSIHSHLAASYLAAYGPLTQSMLAKGRNISPERVRPIGSPRFDDYILERKALLGMRTTTLQVLGLDPSRPVVLVSVPMNGVTPILLSSFGLADFFNTFGEVHEALPQVQILFKFRPGIDPARYAPEIAKAFPEGGVGVTNALGMLPLILASDIVCSGNSTVIYEAMLGKKPFILFPWRPYDHKHFSVYEEAAPAALSVQRLIDLITEKCESTPAAQAIERQDEFLAKNYSFDGKAALRMTNLLREELLPLP